MSKSFLRKQQQGNHNHSPTGRKGMACNHPYLDKHMYTFHQKTQIAGWECRLKTGTAALEQVAGQCQGKLSRVEANVRFSTQGVQQNMKTKVSKQVATWETTALCTFSLQLSSTSVLIRLSHPSVNHAGSLQHTNAHTQQTHSDKSQLRLHTKHTDMTSCSLRKYQNYYLSLFGHVKCILKYIKHCLFILHICFLHLPEWFSIIPGRVLSFIVKTVFHKNAVLFGLFWYFLDSKGWGLRSNLQTLPLR